MKLAVRVAAALAMALTVLMIVPVSGQEEGRPPRGREGAGMPMRPMQPASICALGDYLFIVRGNTIYKIDPQTLEVVKKATYEEEEMMKPPKRPETPPEDEGR